MSIQEFYDFRKNLPLYKKDMIKGGFIGFIVGFLFCMMVTSGKFEISMAIIFIPTTYIGACYCYTRELCPLMVEKIINLIETIFSLCFCGIITPIAFTLKCKKYKKMQEEISDLKLIEIFSHITFYAQLTQEFYEKNLNWFSSQGLDIYKTYGELSDDEFEKAMELLSKFQEIHILNIANNFEQK